MKNQGTIKKAHPAYMLTIITLLFAIPVVIAWALYIEKDTLGQPTNRGQLITPPFSISQLSLHNAQGAILNNRLTPHAIATANHERKATVPTTNGKWLLLLVNQGLCTQTCAQALFNLRQIRLATGKRSARVSRAILTFSDVPQDIQLKQLLATQRYAGTRHLSTNQKQFNRVIREHVTASYATQSGTVFIVDPLGNVMMAYRPEADPSAIYKDLIRLLKVSQIG